MVATTHGHTMQYFDGQIITTMTTFRFVTHIQQTGERLVEGFACDWEASNINSDMQLCFIRTVWYRTSENQCWRPSSEICSGDADSEASRPFAACALSFTVERIAVIDRTLCWVRFDVDLRIFNTSRTDKMAWMFRWMLQMLLQWMKQWALSYLRRHHECCIVLAQWFSTDSTNEGVRGHTGPNLKSRIVANENTAIELWLMRVRGQNRRSYVQKWYK